MLGTGVNLIYILSKIDSKLCLETSHNVRWILEMTFSFIYFIFFLLLYSSPDPCARFPFFLAKSFLP